MPRIRLHRENKGNNYKTVDRLIKQYFVMGGTRVFVHKLIGSYDENGDVDGEKIQDLILMENRDRAYDKNIYAENAIYQMSDSDFELSQFGFFSSDSLMIDFHLNDHTENIGRRLAAGDVLELIHLRDDMIEGKEGAINAFYVVKEARRPADGYDMGWMPHLWRVRCSKMTASKEYNDIIDDDDFNDLLNGMEDNLNQINDGVIEEAEAEVPSNDPSTDFIYREEFKDSVEPEEEIDLTLVDRGTLFPVDAEDGDYFIRTDFKPMQLFKYENDVWVRLNIQDIHNAWTRGHAYQNSFNINDDEIENNGQIEKAKTSIVNPHLRVDD